MRSEVIKNGEIPNLPIVIERGRRPYILLCCVSVFSILFLIWIRIYSAGKNAKNDEIIDYIIFPLVLFLLIITILTCIDLKKRPIAAIITIDGISVRRFLRKRERFYNWNSIVDIVEDRFHFIGPWPAFIISAILFGKAIGKNNSFISDFIIISSLVFFSIKLLEFCIHKSFLNKYGPFLSATKVSIYAVVDIKKERNKYFIPDRFESFFIEESDSQKIVNTINNLKQKYT